MNLRSFLLIPLISSLVACGGIDEPTTPPGDTSTLTGCLTDSWTRSIVRADDQVDLTYEFLADGTFVERSHVDVIDSGEYFSGINDTNFDLEVLPGVSIDAGTLMQIFGPFYSEGYFYTRGSWTLNEADGIISLRVPTKAFGHSVWSASGAESKFNRSYSSTSLAYSTTTQYAYCQGNRLVVGAYHKDDDSDIAGQWTNLIHNFYVAPDHEGAALEFLNAEGEMYSSNSYAMTLQQSGYELASCVQRNPVRGTNRPQFYLADDSAEERVIATGVSVPDSDVDGYAEIVTDNYFYSVEDGKLYRTDVNSGARTLLLDQGSGQTFRKSVLIPGGFAMVTSRWKSSTGESSYSLVRVADNSNDVLQLGLGYGTFEMVYEYAGNLVVGDYQSSQVLMLAHNSTQIRSLALPATSVAATGLYLNVSGGELLLVLSGNEFDLVGSPFTKTLMKYDVASDRIVRIADVTDSFRIFGLMQGVNGYDFYGSGADSSEYRFGHLSADDGYALSRSTVVDGIDRGYVSPTGALNSTFVALRNGTETGIYRINSATGATTLISSNGYRALNYILTDDGARLIAKPYFSGNTIAVIDVQAGTEQRVTITGYPQVDSAAFDGAALLYVGTNLYAASAAHPQLSLLSTGFAFGDEEAAFGKPFMISDNHVALQARKDYSGLELMLVDPQARSTEVFDFTNVPYVSSLPVMHGAMGGRTLFSAWDTASSCFAQPGSLKFEGGYLWYEDPGKGFPGTYWFDRD